jgi:hypothetical protein
VGIGSSVATVRCSVAVVKAFDPGNTAVSRHNPVLELVRTEVEGPVIEGNRACPWNQLEDENCG